MRGLFGILLICLMEMMSTVSFAVEADYKTLGTKATGKEQNLSAKRTVTKTIGRGKKKTKQQTKGIDKQTQQALNKIKQTIGSTQLEVTINPIAIFSTRIALQEQKNKTSCRVFTKPQLPADFGITASANGLIDTIKLQYLINAAKSNLTIGKVIGAADIKSFNRYRKCMLYDGAIIGQAMLNLEDALRAVAKLKKIKNAKKNRIEVIGIGYEDFYELALASLNKAKYQFRHGMLTTFIKKLYEEGLLGGNNCRFVGVIEKVQCAATTINLTSQPTLTINGVEFFGNHYAAGETASYKISAGWSYVDALNILKSTTKYFKFAKNVEQYADQLVQKGEAKEAILLIKKSVELAESRSNSVSPGRFLPVN